MLALVSGGYARAGAISQIPLFIGSNIDPNIMFILDDSGSMQFEIMPDNDVFWNVDNGSVTFVYPRANNVYGSSDYTNRVATVDADEAYHARTRSPQINKIYYNPAITYKPWAKPDGSSYDNASSTCAYHNPMDTAKGCRNLTVNNDGTSAGSSDTQWRTCNSGGTCSSNADNHTFWPATYFYYNSGDSWDWNSYTRIEIKSGTTTYTGHGRASRTDCTNGVCTYAQEIQNFANWYQYYRSRILAARAGIGWAFAEQGETLRIGFGAINQGSTSIDGVATTTIINGVRPFIGDDRTNFFTNLYGHSIPANGTPLRRALDAAGQYYSRTDSKGPWSSTPGTTGGEDLACRQCYTVLMTDGYWNNGEAATAEAQANVDNQTGPLITNPTPGGENYQYSPSPPYKDDWSNTLADVAMYYWNRDLRADLANKVPAPLVDEAFWQHMVTFGVGLGVFGTLNPETDLEALKNGTKTWPKPDSAVGGPANIDDLWHASLNSRGGFFSAADPNVFAKKLSEVLEAIVTRVPATAASIATNSTRLDAGTLIYQAKFDSSDWSGQMIAYRVNTTNGSVDENNPEWNTDDSGKISAHGSRNIYTWNGSTGREFTVSQWSNLATTQQTDLRTLGGILGTEDEGKDRLNWLRGDQSKEQQNGGTFRNRGIINSR